MQEKEVALIRKQHTPFTVNFPIDGRLKKYVWNGTRGKLLDRKTVPFEVYHWLAQYTSTFEEGMLIIEESKDAEISDIKGVIDDVKNIEKSILTKEEILQILNKGNQHVLKKSLESLIEDVNEEAKSNIKRQVVAVASEEGIDSSTKRKVVAEWAGLDYVNSDLIFDKELNEQYKK